MHYLKTYKIGSIIILRLVLTVAAGRLHPDKDRGCVSAAICYLMTKEA
jgi:hypothetical protein